MKKITEENVRRYLEYINLYDSAMCSYMSAETDKEKETSRTDAAKTLLRINQAWERMAGFVMVIKDSHHARQMINTWLSDPTNEREASDFLCKLRGEPRQLSSLKSELDKEGAVDTQVMAEIHYRLTEHMGIEPFTVEAISEFLESEDGTSNEEFVKILLKHAITCLVDTTEKLTILKSQIDTAYSANPQI